jgi:hypothetical protein
MFVVSLEEVVVWLNLARVEVIDVDDVEEGSGAGAGMCLGLETDMRGSEGEMEAEVK